MKYLSAKSTKNFGLFFLIILVACSFYIVTMSLEKKSAGNKNNLSTIPKTNNPPSAYIKQAYIQSFNKEGQLEFKVKTPKLEQFSNKNIMTLEMPIIDYKANHHYIITAKSGILSNKQDLLLKENAIIKKANSMQSMQSESFNINLPQKIITSEQEITLNSAEGNTTANGLHANINNQIIKLRNGVRGIYEP